MDILAEHYEVQWLNVHPDAPRFAEAERRLFDCDFLLVKSNFGWLPDEAYMRADYRVSRRPPVGLMISGSVPPGRNDLQRFDVLFFETFWYGRFIEDHPLSFHAFGVDAKCMSVVDGIKRDIDWLMVGRPAGFKHPEALMERTGRRVLIGEIHGADRAVEKLRIAGIEVRDFVPYDQLAHMYRRTKTLLVAAELQGGGERAILEARACGAEVLIVNDNAKLEEVARGPVYDHGYYAQQLMAGVEAILGSAGARVKSSRCHSMRWLAANRVQKVPRSIAWRLQRFFSGASRYLATRVLKRP